VDGDDAVVDLVLGKLEGVRQHGGYWMARCPAHDDQKASLSVKRGTEQPVIFYCHAGCERDTILNALNLTLADVSKPRERSHEEWTPRGPAIATYDYVDERGNLLFQVLRTLDKQFPQRCPDGKGGWKWRLGSVRRVPYRLPKVLTAIAEGKPVYIPEGEKDVHSIERAGAVATTSPGGAGNWRDEYDQYFKGATVIIVADADEAGRKHAADVARHLRGTAVSVTITEAATGKDATDHLAAGHALAELAIVEAPRTTGLAVIDLEPAAETVEQPTLVCHDLLYLGAVHTLTGPPDCGKTTLACWWMLQAVRDGRNVLFLDEEGGRELVTEKFQALGAQPGERIGYVPFPSLQWTAANVAELAHVLTDRKPAIIAWDSAAAFLARAGLDENAAADVTRFYTQVLAFCARNYGAAVLVVDHDTKSSEPSRYARGSGAKLAATDVAYKIEPVKPFSKTEDGISKLTITKDRRGYLHRDHDVTFTSGNNLDVAITERSSGQFRPTVLMGRINDVLVANGGEMSFRDLKDRVRGKEEHIREALAVLIDEGNIKRRNGPRGAHLHELVVPFNG
jgi:5S rRNA maturation endonuclease (ribonuclease M5)